MSTTTYSNQNCTLYVRRKEELNMSPMPLIGLYVAAASLLCYIAMLLNSFVTFLNSPRILTYPFSSLKFFGLNATWLTLLAVATKLTGDLTSPMWSYRDNLTKITSTLFLTFAMANFFTSLSSMNNTDMLTNLTALGILVFTVLVNMCIQLGTGVLDFELFPEIIFALVLLFFMFATIVCSALAVPAIKKRVESKYQKLAKQMEGEKQLPKRLLRKIIRGINSHVKGGKKQQPHNLLNLLKQSFFYRGAIEFDSPRVLSLLSEEPPNCWTLPVMTLTSIAVALPNIANQHVDELVSSVDEGLRYASHIDVLDENHVLKNAASVVWVGVKLHKKWLDMDLRDKIGEVRSTKEIIQVLADKAERIVKEFSSIGSKNLVENPFYWPTNVLAANSMYRISRTILLYYENCECQSEELFSKLICMISNILAVCLTNLPHLIATKCINNAFEERFRNVCDAAILFGETEDILKFFEEKQLLGIGPSQPLCIDEWRRWMERQDPTVSTSATGNESSSTVESNEVMIVQM
nr:ATP-dependent RNA helicase [Ipomoea batatas]